MRKSVNKLKELEARIKKKSESGVIEAVNWLRNEEPFEGAIHLLVSHYDSSESTEARNRIRDFMNDIKEISARPEVIEEIKKPYKPETVGMLVSSCWQSGLDYSEYASDIAGIFKTGDYPTALECFTVLEESLHLLSVKSKADIVAILNENPVSDVEGKPELLAELLRMLR